MASNPVLRVVTRAERAVAGPINRAANSGDAADILLLLSRARRTAGGMTERARSVAVHVLSLPSRRDLQILEAKVERLQRTLDELAARERDAESER